MQGYKENLHSWVEYYPSEKIPAFGTTFLHNERLATLAYKRFGRNCIFLGDISRNYIGLLLFLTQIGKRVVIRRFPLAATKQTCSGRAEWNSQE